MEKQIETENGCDNEVIKNGDYVILRRIHDNDSIRLIKVQFDKFVYLGKQKINLNNILGHRFGSTYEIDKKFNLNLVNKSNINDLSKMVTQEVTSKDNRFIQDDGKSQKLSKDDIEVLKNEVSGKEIIENLVKNSSTFSEKTTFAQEKYVKKKLQKYSTFLTVLKPNVRLLTEMYYSQGPIKINFLRIDSLSQMLSHCNVMSGGKYIVLDSYLGILTASVVERLGCDGTVIQVYTDPGPVTTYRQAVDALNIPKQTISQILFGIQINQTVNICDNMSEQTTSQSDHNYDNSQEVNDDKAIRKELRRIETNKAKEILSHRKMDGLLILAKTYDPLNILQLLLNYLSISRPFVVFSPTIEPLANCFMALKKCSVLLRLTETWTRKYQILPDRTRPEMTISGSSGYLLSGIKVDHL